MTVVQACTTPFVVAIFGCAVLLAIVSTTTSVLCSISSNIALDFCAAFVPPPRRVLVCQLVTFGIGMTALAASFQFNNVVALLMQAYELSICSLVIPIALAFSPLRPSTYAAGGAIVAGAIGFIAFRFIELPIPREIASLGLSLLVYDWLGLPNAAATHRTRQNIRRIGCLIAMIATKMF